MTSEYDDPFGDSSAPSSGRRGNLFSGMKGHVSDTFSQHLQPMAQNAFESAKPLAGDAWNKATEYASSNPDKVENIAGKAGGMLGASMGGALTAKLGQKAGKKLGRALSKKAQQSQQQYSQQSNTQSPSSSEYDPF